MFSASPKKASRWNVPMRIWPWLSRVSTDERVGEGSSPRSSASPVSNSAKLFDVLTPSASSISVAKHLADAALERQAAVGVAAVGRLAGALGAEIEQPVRDRRGAARRGSRGRRRFPDCTRGTDGRDSAAPAARRGCRAAARSGRNVQRARPRSARPAQRALPTDR